MRKKLHTLFFSLLVLVYITSSIGVSVYLHYCGGELEKISAVKVKSCCGGMDEKNDSDCCKNESRHLSLKYEFSAAKSLQPVFTMPAQDLFVALQPFKAFVQLPSSASFLSHASAHPPDPIGLAMVQTSVFRI